jgi:hypothetical protein
MAVVISLTATDLSGLFPSIPSLFASCFPIGRSSFPDVVPPPPPWCSRAAHPPEKRKKGEACGGRSLKHIRGCDGGRRRIAPDANPRSDRPPFLPHAPHDRRWAKVVLRRKARRQQQPASRTSGPISQGIESVEAAPAREVATPQLSRHPEVGDSSTAPSLVAQGGHRGCPGSD